MIQGPNGAWVSNDLPSTHWLVRICQSRTETSLPAHQPNTAAGAVSREKWRPLTPITATSSAS